MFALACAEISLRRSASSGKGHRSLLERQGRCLLTDALALLTTIRTESRRGRVPGGRSLLICLKTPPCQAYSTEGRGQVSRCSDIAKTIFAHRLLHVARAVRTMSEAPRKPPLMARRCKRLVWVCAVKRWRFPAGASPARQSLQPEATGAAMEVNATAPQLDSTVRCHSRNVLADCTSLATTV